MSIISADEAWRRLELHLTPLEPETVPRRDGLGRVLARSLSATTDLPAADVSAMDGYAYAGTTAAGERLPVAGTIAAGDPPGATLPGGSALRIMTGAPVPAAADRVIPVEMTRTHGDPAGDQCQVELLTPAEAGAHIRHRGEVLRTGDPLLPAGRLLTPGGIALLASHGHGEISVHRRPRVAVIVTGDEVVAPETKPGPGQLRDTHTDFLLAAGRATGLAFESLGIAPDDVEALRFRVRDGLRRDVLILTGGVSMGEFDFVEGVLQELGCTILFEKVAVQPAKPVVAAVHSGGLVFGLPGNPASAAVAYWLFVRPTLRRLQGIEDAYWHGALAARLAAPLPAAKGRDCFLPASVRFEAGQILVTPINPRGSHDVAAYGQGTTLVQILARSSPRQPGDPCEILPLADWPAG